MDIWTVLCYYFFSKLCLPGGKVTMLTRKRRETTHQKLLKCQEQENYNAQSSKPISDIKTCNVEEKMVESCNFKEFEFSLADIKNWESFVQFMYRPMDPASLGVIRIMFGMYDTML
jgi:hypothetical protein